LKTCARKLEIEKATITINIIFSSVSKTAKSVSHPILAIHYHKIHKKPIFINKSKQECPKDINTCSKTSQMDPVNNIKTDISL